MGLALAWGEFTTGQKMTVLLREARFDDLELIMAWRSNPLVFEGAYTQKAPLTWAEHLQWWKTRGPWWKFWIVQVNDGDTTRDVGVVNLGQLEHWSPEVAYHVGEVSLWGRGVAKRALELVIEWLKARGYCRVHTTVLESNERSSRLLEVLGFKRTHPARKGEWYWELVLSDECNSTDYTSGRKPL